MATNTRETRRRKISEGGTDRLAFITGQIRNLPSSPSLSSPSPSQAIHRSFTESSHHSFSHANQYVSDLNEAPRIETDKAIDAVLRKLNDVQQILTKSTSMPHRRGETPRGPAQESWLKRQQSSMGTPRALFSDIIESPRAQPLEGIETPRALPLQKPFITQPSPVPMTDQSSSISHPVDEKSSEQRARRRRKLFTSNQIVSAIISSELIRLLCSATIALLVVNSYMGFPLLGEAPIKSVITFRPVFLLLVTNTTSVLCRLFLDNKRDSGRISRGETKISSVYQNDLVAQVGYALEMALVMQKVVDAFLMDFGIYAVIVVCGISLS